MKEINKLQLLIAIIVCSCMWSAIIGVCENRQRKAAEHMAFLDGSAWGVKCSIEHMMKHEFTRDWEWIDFAAYGDDGWSLYQYPSNRNTFFSNRLWWEAPPKYFTHPNWYEWKTNADGTVEGFLKGRTQFRFRPIQQDAVAAGATLYGSMVWRMQHMTNGGEIHYMLVSP